MSYRVKLYSNEYYTLKKNSNYSYFNKQECGASLDYSSNIPSACILFRDKNKALRRFSYILNKVVKKFFLIEIIYYYFFEQFGVSFFFS